MRARLGAVGCFCVSMVLSMASVAFGFSNFTVQINGSSVDTSGGSPLTLTTPSGVCYTISGLDGTNPAKIIGNESAPDEIFIENLKITAGSANCSGDILFWATFNQPQYAQTVKVTAERYAGVGALKRGSGGAVNSWFKVTGWVNDLDGSAGDNEVGSWQKKTATATSFTFDFTKSEDWLPVSLMNDRNMKLQFWFNLTQSGDVLELPLARVRTPGGGAGNPKNDNSVANSANDLGISSGEYFARACCLCPWWKRIFFACPKYDQ